MLESAIFLEGAMVGTMGLSKNHLAALISNRIPMLPEPLNEAIDANNAELRSHIAALIEELKPTQ